MEPRKEVGSSLIKDQTRGWIVVLGCCDFCCSISTEHSPFLNSAFTYRLGFSFLVIICGSFPYFSYTPS